MIDEYWKVLRSWEDVQGRFFDHLCKIFEVNLDVTTPLFKYSTDSYDRSLELYDPPGDFVITKEQMKKLHNLGLSLVFVNKVNKVCDIYYLDREEMYVGGATYKPFLYEDGGL